MKRELEETDSAITRLEKCEKDMGVKLTGILLYFSQKRVDIANKIGKKKQKQ